MKIGICSDSHDNLTALKALMQIFRDRGVEAVIHAGDFVAPFTVDALREAGCPVYAVFGNCDGERVGLKKRFDEEGWHIFREPHIYEFESIKIALMHHPEWIDAFARKELVDMVVYGHMHELNIEENEVIIINPGEVFGHRSDEGSTGVYFDTETGEPEVIYI